MSVAMQLHLVGLIADRFNEALAGAQLPAAVLQIELDEDGREVELGKGAFGVVVRGRYRLSPVAIKRLINQRPEQQAQFLQEMAILRACRGSRYIVPFVGASLLPVSAWMRLSTLQNLSACPWALMPPLSSASDSCCREADCDCVSLGALLIGL